MEIHSRRKRRVTVAVVATTSIMTFGGYTGHTTIVNEGHVGFTWDNHDTEGKKVD